MATKGFLSSSSTRSESGRAARLRRPVVGPKEVVVEMAAEDNGLGGRGGGAE